MSTAIRDHRVLVVEDDHDVRQAIVEILSDNQFYAVEAANGQEALDHLHADPHKPCVILLDIMMPIMDGWEFRRVQKADPELRSIPVVVLTAHANLEEAAAGMDEVTCLKKPVELRSLIALVKRYCRPSQDHTPA